VATSAKRRRQVERQRWERQQARRQAGQYGVPRAREVLAIVGVSAVVVAVAIWLSGHIDDDTGATSAPPAVEAPLALTATTSPPPV